MRQEFDDNDEMPENRGPRPRSARMHANTHTPIHRSVHVRRTSLIAHRLYIHLYTCLQNMVEDCRPQPLSQACVCACVRACMRACVHACARWHYFFVSTHVSDVYSLTPAAHKTVFTHVFTRVCSHFRSQLCTACLFTCLYICAHTCVHARVCTEIYAQAGRR